MRWFSGRSPTGRDADPALRGSLLDDALLGEAFLRDADGWTLLAVLDEAVSHLDDAERLLERCADGALHPADARLSLRLRVTFTRLSDWIEHLPCAPEHLALRERAARLLEFYLLMVKHAMDAACASASTSASASRRLAIRGGKESAAAELVALRDAVRESVG